MPCVALPGVTTIATTVSAVRAAPLSSAVTVTLCALPLAPSEIASGDSDSNTAVEGCSSSVIVSVRASGCVTPGPVVSAVPDTSTALSAAAISLLTAAIVTVPVLVVCPAAIVSREPFRR